MASDMESKLLVSKAFVSMRCGENNHHLHSKTLPSPVKGKDRAQPVWTEAEKNFHSLKRHAHDEGILVLSIYEACGLRHDFIGGSHLHIDEYVASPNKVFNDVAVKLFDSGHPDEGSGCGTLYLKVKWAIDQSKAPEHTEHTEHTEHKKHKSLLGSVGNALLHHKSGRLEVTVLRVDGLQRADRVIRDLSTHVDYTEIQRCLLYLIVYLLSGFLFYKLYMNNKELEELAGPDLMQELYGEDNEEGWTALDTWVFMITSFTTVGYGNHPSLVRNEPTCEYPGMSLAEAPASNLPPQAAQQKSVVDMGFTDGVVPFQLSSGEELDASCFTDPTAKDFSSLMKVTADGYDYNGWLDGPGKKPECWIIADGDKVFDFRGSRLYERSPRKEAFELVDVTNASSIAPALPGCKYINPATKKIEDQSYEQVYETLHPGYKFHDSGVNTTTMEFMFRACVKRCETVQLGKFWRKEEAKKNTAKLVTIVFILAGIGVLGTVSGAMGNELMALARKTLVEVEHMVDYTAVNVIPGETVSKIAETKGHIKEITIAFMGLIMILSAGTIAYSHLDHLNYTDAAYFTVVTATTVGFGDYCPTTFGSKVFTCFYVPVSVVMVAAAIDRVAQIPLQKRNDSLEDYVLHQFTENLAKSDFDDVRRTSGLGRKKEIRVNDFVVAMLIRLGKIDSDETTKIRHLFALLDEDHSGMIDNAAIEHLVTGGATHAFKAAVAASPKNKKGGDAVQKFANPIVESDEESPSGDGDDSGEGQSEPKPEPEPKGDDDNE